MDCTKCVTLMSALLLLGAFVPSEACRCLQFGHLQKPFCDADAAIKVMFIEVSNEGPASPSNTNGTGFDSKTLQVLNGVPALQNSTFIVSYMADTSCRYSHPEDGFNIPYLLTGPVINGNVGVAGCSFPKPWSELTTSQITGLEGAYKPGCGKCEIIKPPTPTCASPPCEPAKNTCVLVDENQEKNQACLPDGYGACAWKTI